MVIWSFGGNELVAVSRIGGRCEAGEKRVRKMGVVLSIRRPNKNIDSHIGSYSIVDMILNPAKKKEADIYYDKHYDYVKQDDFAKKIFGERYINQN